MASIVRFVLYLAIWLGGLAATRAVLAGQPLPEAFPRLAWPAAAVALWGAAGAYGILASAWQRLVTGWHGVLRVVVGLFWAGLAALALLAGLDAAAAFLPDGTAAGPALLPALFRSRPLWLAGLLLALAAGTLGARGPARRRRYSGFGPV